MTILVDGRPIDAAPGMTLAGALLAAGAARWEPSITGQERGPLCGMGICFGCRVTVTGLGRVRSCMVECREGMEVATHAA